MLAVFVVFHLYSWIDGFLVLRRFTRRRKKPLTGRQRRQLAIVRHR